MVPFSIDLIQNLGLNVLKAKNLFKFRTILLMIVAVANIFVSIPAIYFYGKIGTAIITASSLFIGNVVIMNIYYYKKIGLDILGFWRTITRLILAFILAICCSQLLWEITKPSITWISIIEYILYYTVLAGVSLFCIGMTKEQRRKWLESLRKGGTKFWS